MGTFTWKASRVMGRKIGLSTRQASNDGSKKWRKHSPKKLINAEITTGKTQWTRKATLQTAERDETRTENEADMVVVEDTATKKNANAKINTKNRDCATTTVSSTILTILSILMGQMAATTTTTTTRSTPRTTTARTKTPAPK